MKRLLTIFFLVLLHINISATPGKKLTARLQISNSQGINLMLTVHGVYLVHNDLLAAQVYDENSTPQLIVNFTGQSIDSHENFYGKAEIKFPATNELITFNNLHAKTVPGGLIISDMNPDTNKHQFLSIILG